MNHCGSAGLQVSPGDRYEWLKIVGEAQRKNCKRRMVCECKCGKIVTVYLSALRTGNTTSCGCRRDELTRQRNAGNKYHLGHYKKCP